jgi:hypothetical protein
MMKKMIMAVAAVATLAAALPAAAQPYTGGHDRGGYGGGYGGGYSDGRDGGINERQQRLSWRINQAERSGDLSHWEARRLRENLWTIKRLEARYRYGGLNRWEHNDLDQRLDRLSRQIRFEQHDDDRYRRY